jgi:hypothetical protein
MIMSKTKETLIWQFELTWKLAQYHLEGLSDAACFFEPTMSSWTVKKSDTMLWIPDWQVPEPEPIPTPTIAWLTWHIIWWWTNAHKVINGGVAAEHTEVYWPGSAAAAVSELNNLSTKWSAALSNLDDQELELPRVYPWKEPRPTRILIAWVNSELMKNISEIGYIKHLFALATHD